jgi:hypothetical protein
MSSSSLIRLGGLATVLAGVLMILTIIAQVMGVIDFANIAEEATTGTYALLTWLVVLTVILLQGGLVALYAERSEAMGVLGAVGFVVAFVGTALTLGYLWAEAFVVPAVAEIAPTQLDPIHDIGTWVGARVLAGVLFGIGWVLFGVAAHQARVYPDWERGSL